MVLGAVPCGRAERKPLRDCVQPTLNSVIAPYPDQNTNRVERGAFWVSLLKKAKPVTIDEIAT